MATIGFSKVLLSAIAASALATSAFAGGFARGEADTDILYEDAAGAFRTGLTYVIPSRDYETISGVYSAAVFAWSFA